MAPVKVPNYNKWTRPPAVYEDNYGYGINFYQPMIDYISAKENGVPKTLPHLPWNNERALDKYKFGKVQTYSDQEVAKISREVAAQAKRDLNTFDVTTRTPFSVVATAAAANVTKHVGIESVTTKNKKKKIDREKIKVERQKKRMEEIEKELQTYEAEANVGADLRSKALMYRGKSAGAIAQVLLEESRKNVAEGKFRKNNFVTKNKEVDRNYTALSKKIMAQTLEEKLSSQTERKISETMTETIRTIREVSPTTCIVRINTETPIIVDNSYLYTLQDLKETLKEFESLSSSVLIDRR
ncbi:LOW QUALITY PROTEIN: paramyosin, short form-like [Aphomia sociella]